MKKVLILAYDFPPYVSVASLRPFNWYKYLNEYSVYPIVVTRQWANFHKNHLDYVSPGQSDDVIIEESESGTIIRTPYRQNLANKLYVKYGDTRYRFLRRSITAFFELAQFVFLVGPKRHLFFAADEFLKTHRVDAIVATGGPFILFRYASLLSKKHGVPWIADYRDPWSQNVDNDRSGGFYFYNKYNEIKALKNVSVITTVSDYFKNKISELLGNKRFEIIANGYDPEAMERASQVKQNSETFSIALAGSVLKWHPVESFLRAFHQFYLADKSRKLALNFYGINTEQEIQALLDTTFPAIKPMVHFFPRTPNVELLPLLAQNNVLLLFNYYSYSGTKIYDYLALSRCILLCYSNDAEADVLKKQYYNIKESPGDNGRMQEDLIHSTHAGYVVKDYSHLIVLLNDLYAEFRDTGKINCLCENYSQYSRKTQTKILADLIDGLKN